jgi:hypothetical protein
MSLRNQTPWRVGPIEARGIIGATGDEMYIGNVEAPIQLDDAVIKFFPMARDGSGPIFVIESRRDFKDKTSR